MVICCLFVVDTNWMFPLKLLLWLLSKKELVLARNCLKLSCEQVRWRTVTEQTCCRQTKKATGFTASRVPRIFQLTPAPHSTPCRRQQLIWVSVVKSFKTSFSATSLCLTPITRCSLFSSPNLSRLNYSHSIYWSILETAVYIIWATDIDLHSNKMFRQLHWLHLKFGLFTCKVCILLLPKTHVDDLNLKSLKTSCASCFSPQGKPK